jgi:SAM-dependent methyltransferase
MVIASVNANKRLGARKAQALFRAWLTREGVDLVFAQEAWRVGREGVVEIPDMVLVEGDAELAVWVRVGLEAPATTRAAPWWQIAHVGETTVHSVHLDPYSSSGRVEQLDALADEIPRGDRILIVGDFNLAPRPCDGVYGSEPSTFTSQAERDAFSRLLTTHALVDGTADQEAGFTISRTIRGKPASFRCDLALRSESMSAAVVAACSATREGPTAFTDHAALIVELDEELDRRPAARALPLQQSLFELDDVESAPCAHAAYKTAMRRRSPSAPAAACTKQILAWASAIEARDAAGDVLDFGCGTGTDVRYYADLGLDAEGYDPHPPFGFDDLPTRSFKVVAMMFVLNVIPTAAERLDAMRSAASFALPGGRLVVATRSPAAVHEAAYRGGWRAWGDGFVSHEGRSTFQRGLDAGEIHALGTQVGLVAAEELPGVAGATVVALRRQR